MHRVLMPVVIHHGVLIAEIPQFNRGHAALRRVLPCLNKHLVRKAAKLRLIPVVVRGLH